MPNNIGIDSGGINGSDDGGGALVGDKSNGVINSFGINDDEINGPEFLANGVGLLVSIEQILSVAGSGLLISFEQSVELRLSADSGVICSFEQTVKTIGSGLLISIEQYVYNPSVSTFLSRNGWYPMITVNGWRVPDNQITGTCQYSHSESNNALFDFSIRPPIGVQSLFEYQGKTVTCDIITSAGTHRIFTGYVDIPEVDVMNEKITFRCVDNRLERIRNGGAGSPALIGYYNTVLFGDVVTIEQEVLDRLTTVPSSLDWDGYGNPYLTQWYPKVTSDYTFGNSHVYRKNPAIRIESRAQIINKVNIKFRYTYQRRHAGTVDYSWTSSGASVQGVLVDGVSLTERSMIYGVAGDGLVGDIDFNPILPSGTYYVGRYGVVMWSTTRLSGTVSNKTDALGNQVTDSAGSNVVEGTITGGSDLGSQFASAANWTTKSQWVQNIIEDYSIVVTAPQSSSRYGVVENTLVYDYSDTDTTDEWEGKKSVTGAASYEDQDINADVFLAATQTAVQIARTKIIEAHRDSRVFFETQIKPELDLRHTITVSSDRVSCQGKIAAITHTFDIGDTCFASTAVEVAIYRATGYQIDDNLTYPTRPTDTVDPLVQRVRLPSQYGIDYRDFPKKTGYFGNKLVTGMVNGYLDTRKTTVPVTFILDTPDIPSSYRENRTLTASKTYNIAIPPDTLTWTTIGK